MARTTEGKLYTAGKKGHYYFRFTARGKDCRVRLLGTDGKPITTRPEAVKAAARILKPIQETDRAEQLRMLKNNLQDAEEAASIADKLLKNGKATISNGWTLFMSCQSRPASCKRFPAAAIPRHSTPGNYAGYYRQFTDWIREIHPEISLLSEVTPDIGGEYAGYLDRITGAAGTYNKIIQFFKMFFNTLLEDEKIDCRNPFQKIRRKEQESNSRRPLTVEQIARLIQETSGEDQLLIALGYFTGLRFGDCCTLLWREIDLLRGVIERIPRKTRHTRKDKAESTVKIGIPAFLMQLLEKTPPEARTGYLLPEIGTAYDSGKSSNLTRRILRAFDKAGIQTHKAGTGIIAATDENGKPIIDETGKAKKTGCRAIVEIGFHSLRYSYISHNAEKGTPAAIIQKNAGHASPAMTEHYTRISDQAALQYAGNLSLPLPADENIIEAEVLNPDCRDNGRDPADGGQLARLQDMIQTLNAEQIKNVIAYIQRGAGK
ncbi:MAG: site-specific integrase [Lentisphaerae bacterium]|nr:site-specific integrase [Lentisphaerota bacterium]